MDINNNQGDWRDQLHPESRQRFVNKIMEDLKKHIPDSCQVGLLDLQYIAQRFEEKNFTVATSLSDYVTKISLRMLAWITSPRTMVPNITSSLDMLTLETESSDTMTNNITSSLNMETESQGTMANSMETESQGTMANNMETESQGTMANNMTSNQVGPINEPLDPANGRPGQGDWRGKLQPGTRERTVNKLFDTLKRRLPFSDQEGLRQLRKLAQRFEKRIFTAATSESDYAMKIFLKSLKIETKLPGSLANNMTWNQIDPSNKPLDPANERPNQGDWRGTLQPGTRERTVNQLFDILERCLSFCDQAELRQLPKLAQRFEERIFTAATSESDYAMKINLKSLAIETKLQGSLANNMMCKRIGPSNNPLDPANGRPNQGDWRGTLQPEAREKIINRIMDMLKEHLPIVSGQEGSDEFGKIVQSFEEGIFTSATDKADYIKKIYLKTRALKTQCQDPEMYIIALKTQCQDPEMNIIALKLAQLIK